MGRAMQRPHALDGQPVAADPLDPRAHRHQALGEVGNLRFAGGIRQHGLPVGQRRGHQQVLGRADADERKHDGRAMQPFWRGGVHVAALQPDLRTHLLQPLQVEIDRPRPDRAPAGQRHPRFPHARHQRPQHQERRAHLAHDVVRRHGVADGSADRQRPPIVGGTLHGHTVMLQQARHVERVRQQRHVAQHQPLIRQQPRGHQRQAGVFRPADHDFAVQRSPATDPNSVHVLLIPYFNRAVEVPRRVAAYIFRRGRRS